MPDASVTIPPAPLFRAHLCRIGGYGFSRRRRASAGGVSRDSESRARGGRAARLGGIGWLLVPAGITDIWLAIWALYLAAMLFAAFFGGLRFRSVRVGRWRRRTRPYAFHVFRDVRVRACPPRRVIRLGFVTSGPVEVETLTAGTPGMSGLRAGAIVFVAVGAANVCNYLFHLFSARSLGPASYSDVATLAGLIGIIILPLGGSQVFVARHVAAQDAKGRTLNDGDYVSGFAGAMLACRRSAHRTASPRFAADRNLALDREPARRSARDARHPALVPHPGDDRRGARPPAVHARRNRPLRSGCDPRRPDRERASGRARRERHDGRDARRQPSSPSPFHSWRSGRRSRAPGDLGFRDREALALVPVIAGMLAISLLTTDDLVAAKVAFTPHEAGLYGGASLIGRVILYLPVAIVTVLLPNVSARSRPGGAPGACSRTA